MKIIRKILFKLVLILSILASILAFSKSSLTKSLAPEATKPAGDKPASKPGVNDTAGNSTDSFVPALPSEKSTNDISSPPYIVTSCEKMFYIKGDTLSDFEDFTKKKPSYFSFNLYMVNRFEEPDNTKLRDNIFLENIKVEPYILKGSVSCVLFQHENYKKKITMCLDNKQKAEQIIEAYRAYLKCRHGDNLKQQDQGKMYRIKKFLQGQRCGGFNMTNSTNMTSLTETSNKALLLNKDFGKWKPAFIGNVPGSL